MHEHRGRLERQHRGARTTRLRRPQDQAFVVRLTPRPPHPAATCRDVRNAPLFGQDAGIDTTDLPDDGSGIFLREGMDRLMGRLLVICPSG
jgi:hypothetical protein